MKKNKDQRLSEISIPIEGFNLAENFQNKYFFRKTNFMWNVNYHNQKVKDFKRKHNRVCLCP